jgi:hypothetical protein
MRVGVGSSAGAVTSSRESIHNMDVGEETAWENLEALPPADVSARTGAAFDEGSGLYRLAMFGHPVEVSPAPRTITGHSPEAEHVLTKLAYFSRLSVLGFLIHAQDIPPSGRLIKPEEMVGVDVMTRGSHTLPLAKIAARYANNAEGLLARGRTYGGVPESYGDASLLLHPFRSIPVTLVLWSDDNEFPARCSLLLDSATRHQAPPDIIWCIMMMTSLAMM